MKGEKFAGAVRNLATGKKPYAFRASSPKRFFCVLSGVLHSGTAVDGKVVFRPAHISASDVLACDWFFASEVEK